ncbi:MAG TPA: class I SAM-dependent methyltransferase, partial [Beijerinckiaceae bacterium]|nr:class I SAM-dependent methyltransferase [Beijerinckiaceae bacterium]
MAENQIRFDDGAAYEEMMGVWSRLAGEVFLNWLAPSGGLKWIDVGCGNAASTAMIVDRCAPSEIQGIDPSEGQLAYARSRLAGSVAQFRQGEGAALPFPDGGFDIGVMALVVFFLPDPAKGVAEMARVVRPGGMIAAYAWDMLGGGFTLEPIFAELRKLGVS